MSRKYVEAGVSKIARSNARFYTARLAPDQFRLLSYDEPSGTWSFQTHTLSNGPAYVAISYTWGPNEDTSYADDTVINKDGVPRYLNAVDHGQEMTMNEDSGYSLEIDGETFAVSQNVWELATQAIHNKVELLAWVDALCINQSDPEERNSQVRNMAQIFYDAEYVLTWLGTDESNEAEVVLDLCKAIQTEYLKQTDNGDRNATPRKVGNIWEPGVLESMGLPPTLDERWNTLARFFDRRWFNRLWVIQEIVMASNPRFWWGATEIDRVLLNQVSAFILQSQFPLNSRRERLPSGYQTSEVFKLRRKIGETLAKITSFKYTVFVDEREVDGQPYLMDSYDRQMDVVGGSKYIDGELRKDCMRHWANMLETNRSFDAMDPRDYIYATYNIIDTAAANREWTMCGIEVDYAKSVAEVYADAAKRIMEASKCLNLISLAQDPQMRRQHTLPSWVPDFSARGEIPILLSNNRRWKVMPHVYDLAKKLNDSSSAAFHVLDDLKTLQVNAIRLDTVSKTGESHYEATNSGMWERIAEILLSQDSFANNESPIDSLWRTMVANTDMSADDVAGPEMATLFKSFVKICVVVSTFNDRDHLEKLPKWKKLTELHRAECNNNEEAAVLPSFEYVKETVEYLDRVVAEVEAGGERGSGGPVSSQAGIFGLATEPMYYRRILLTGSGYLGFGPMSTLPNDEIWILPGMPLPTILRKGKTESQYTVLGESYLHGNPDFSAQYSTGNSEWIDLV